MLLQDLVRFMKPGRVYHGKNIDGDVLIAGTVFRLLCKPTAFTFAALGLLFTSSQYFGDPIYCTTSAGSHGGRSGSSGGGGGRSHSPLSRLDKVVTSYCWTHATFTVSINPPGNTVFSNGVSHGPNRGSSSSRTTADAPYPGVITSTPSNSRSFYHYYQWVGIVLLLQAVTFAMPNYLWYRYEDRLVYRLVGPLGQPLLPEQVRDSHVERLVDYLFTPHDYQRYLMAYLACELLACVNVIVQWYWNCHFIFGTACNNQGKTWGIDILFRRYYNYYYIGQSNSYHSDYSLAVPAASAAASDNNHQEELSLLSIFPRVTKCKWYQFGPSGDVESLDALCLLPYNGVYEKVYLFLWYWVTLLVVCSAIELAYCLLSNLLWSHQLAVYRLSFHRLARDCDDLDCKLSHTDSSDIHTILDATRNRSSYRRSRGYLFLLKQLSTNIDSSHFALVLRQLASRMLVRPVRPHQSHVEILIETTVA